MSEIEGTKGPIFKRILVVKLADIGDLLTATPAMRALRETFSTSHIAALVTPESASVLEGSSLVDDVLIFDKHKYDRFGSSANLSSARLGLELLFRLRRNAYDCVVILHHLVTRWGTFKYAALALASGASSRVGLDNGRGWFLTHRAADHGFGSVHEVEYALAVVRSIGATTDNLKLDLPFTKDDVAAADRLLDGMSSRPIIAVHPGSGLYSVLRRWPAERFSEVADALAASEGAQIVIVGGPGEIELCEEVASRMRCKPLVLAGKTNIKQLAALLERCDLFIGNDSGVMHVAAAVGTKVVAVFGPSNYRAWAPWTSSGPIGEAITGIGAVITGASPCSPCLYGADWGRRRRVPCDNAECLRKIAPDDVLGAARQVLTARESQYLLKSQRCYEEAEVAKE